MTLRVLGHDFAYEMECVVRLFYPGAKIAVEKEPGPSGGDQIVTELREGEAVGLSASVCLGGTAATSSAELSAAASSEERERRLAVLLFGLLADRTGRRPPWGILTGVRPVRLCRAMAGQGLDREGIRRRLTEDFLVRPDKADLALAVKAVQEPVLAGNRPGDFSLYISIPFCPSRCLYCSFVSHEIEKCRKLIPEYVELLCGELRETAALARRKKLRLRAVYMGGGTPTTLSAAELRPILETVRNCYDLSAVGEYTVEAGRPDTVTREKLAVLREFGADRISVNPQTMEDAVLERIGRLHTAEQVLESFGMAREAGFDRINMDLIAGLPGDSDQGFRRTVDKVLALLPENITIHTLTVKRSSALRGRDGAFDEPDMELPALLDEAAARLEAAGYRPFYMYRQKGTRGNLENVGYARPGFESPYNINVMEEVQTVLAVGAGGVSKVCGADGRDIRRVYNYKYPYEYIGDHGEILRRKEELERLL